MTNVVEQQVSSRNSQIPGSFIPGQEPYATEEIVALFMLERATEHGKNGNYNQNCNSSQDFRAF